MVSLSLESSLVPALEPPLYPALELLLLVSAPASPLESLLSLPARLLVSLSLESSLVPAF